MVDDMTPAQRSYTMSRIRSAGNLTTELRFLRLLRLAGITGWRRKVKLPGHPDLVFRRQRVVVFLDGCFWHGCPRCYAPPQSNVEYWTPKVAGNAARDKRIRAELRSAEWRVVRIWEHSIRKEPSRALRRLQGALSKGSRRAPGAGAVRQGTHSDVGRHVRTLGRVLA